MSLENFNQILFWLAIFTLAWNVYFIIFNRGIPNIRTAPALRRKMIELLREDSRSKHSKGPYTVIDLGSGNGLLTREIARAMPEARVIGLEISRQQHAWAVMMKRREKLANLEYKRADFFKYDLSRMTAVVLFQLATDSVARKLSQDLKPGTLVISNKFPLGYGWKHERLLHVKTWNPFQKKLYVYYKT